MKYKKGALLTKSGVGHHHRHKVQRQGTQADCNEWRETYFTEIDDQNAQTKHDHQRGRQLQ